MAGRGRAALANVVTSVTVTESMAVITTVSWRRSLYRYLGHSIYHARVVADISSVTSIILVYHVCQSRLSRLSVSSVRLSFSSVTSVSLVCHVCQSRLSCLSFLYVTSVSRLSRMSLSSAISVSLVCQSRLSRLSVSSVIGPVAAG